MRRKPMLIYIANVFLLQKNRRKSKRLHANNDHESLSQHKMIIISLKVKVILFRKSSETHRTSLELHKYTQPYPA